MFELPGVRLLLEPSDFIYSDKTTLDILIDKLAKLKTPLSLYRLPGHSLVPAALKRAYKGKAKVVMLDYKNYPFIDLCDTDISRILSSRMRQDIRRAQRKAEKYGEISFDIQSPRNESEFAAMFNDLLFVESKSWKGKAGSALAFDPDRRRFYYEYGIRSCERGALRMCFMRINSQPVAAQLAIEEEKRFWLLKTGYCDNYANCSPGNLLMHETLKYALSKGLLSYEFLGAAEKWTKRWTSTERNSLSVAVYPYNLNGLLAIIGDGFRYLWVKILKYPINRLINNIYSYRRS
jgi:CelD/BcsL family acetyltransferase involved in cellulose biosynthesis